MEFPTLHSWSLSQADAVALQKQLAASVETDTPLGDYELVAGADVSYDRDSPVLHAAVVLLRRGDWEVVEVAGAVGTSVFPYIPGLLSFREAPVLLQAFAALRHRPDVVMIDGQGIAHPRRLGIASHVGLWLGVPTVGCAKSRLTGRHAEPGPQRGDQAALIHRGEVVGTVLRAKVRANPLYVSVGHRVDLESSVRLVLDGLRGYRLPEPTRQAHLHVNELRRQAKG